MCCLRLCCRLRQCWRRCVGCCVVVTVHKKNDICNYRKYPARDFSIAVLKLLRKFETASNYSHYSFILIRKINLHHVKYVHIFAEMVPSVRRLGVATHTEGHNKLRLGLGWGQGQPGSRVAIDCVTGPSRSSSINAERRLNVQSGKRRSKVNKCCGHMARALPSVIVGTVCGKPMGSLK